MYVPFEQGGEQFTPQSAFVVTAQGDETNLMTAIRATVRQMDRTAMSSWRRRRCPTCWKVL